MPPTPFAYADSPHPVRSEIASSHQAFWRRLASPGAHWTGEQRLEIAREAREARRLRSEPPWSRNLRAASGEVLPVTAAEVVRTISLDAHKIDRAWANEVIGELGDAAYVELVAIAVQTTALDAFAEAIGVAPEPLPAPDAGSAQAARPDGLGDIGAFVPVALPYPGPNVGRAMSLAPDDNATFFGLVGSMYAVSDFGELVWKDRPLSRPQVELVAARVSAINECFY